MDVFFVGVAGAVLGVAALMLGYLTIRAGVLAGKKATFAAWLVRPGGQQWIRGVALYGRVTLAWYRLASPSLRAEVSLKRTMVDVVGRPLPSRDREYIIVRLLAPEGLYTFAVAPGDAAGLISWVNSAHPGLESS